MVAEVDNKRIKHLIDIPLLVKVYSWEERRIIFGKHQSFRVLWYF